MQIRRNKNTGAILITPDEQSKRNGIYKVTAIRSRTEDMVKAGFPVCYRVGKTEEHCKTCIETYKNKIKLNETIRNNK